MFQACYKQVVELTHGTVEPEMCATIAGAMMEKEMEKEMEKAVAVLRQEAVSDAKLVKVVADNVLACVNAKYKADLSFLSMRLVKKYLNQTLVLNLT